ncbi:MAG: thrombospondin type 3 repeat-containing protein [Myxococcota bacterium]
MTWKKLCCLALILGGCDTEVVVTFTDTDGDGVEDLFDICPGTPAGIAVDARGCDINLADSDGDGISDAFDICPSTPPGTTVDVRGCDVGSFEGTLSTQWTIQGLPATLNSCADAGIAFVRFNVRETTPSGPLFQSWTYFCDAGGFDSRTDPTAPTVPLNTMFFSNFEALDMNDNVIASSQFLELEVAGHANLINPDFVFDVIPQDVTLSGSWSINGFAATPQSCAEAGVVTVRTTLDDGVAPIVIDAPCGDGFFDGRDDAAIPVADPGVTLNFRYAALDAAGLVLVESELASIVTVAPHSELGTIDFPIVLIDELTISLQWETDLGSGVFTNCFDAEVDVFGFDLFPLGDVNPISTIIEETCDTTPGNSTDVWIFDSEAIATFGPGSYEFVISADALDGTKWSANCPVEFPGGAFSVICDIPVVP